MKVSDLIELLFLAALWGGSFLFMRIAAPVLGPVWLIEMRVLLAGLALLPLFIRLNLWHEARQKLTPLFIVGCINSALPFLLLAFASVFLPAGFTSILNATSPLFGALVAAVWLREKLTLSIMSGLVLGFTGVTVLVGMKTLETKASSSIAIAAGLIAALLYAIAAPYSKLHLSGVAPLAIATISQLGAAIFLLPLLPFTVPQITPSSIILLSVLVLALFSTAIAYILYFRLIQNIGSTKALTVTYLIPVFAMLWGKLLLQEPITISMVLGCSLILFGTAIAMRP
jgi:drug/metabolite transporter (DMT)-like permease